MFIQAACFEEFGLADSMALKFVYGLKGTAGEMLQLVW